MSSAGASSRRSRERSTSRSRSASPKLAAIVDRYDIPEDTAVRMCTVVPAPRRPAMSADELFSGPGGDVNTDLLLQHLRTEGRLSLEAASQLLETAREVLSREPNCVPLEAPMHIVGDIHGQFYDLLHMFDSLGLPPKRKYLFLGDYVDRGIYSTEVAILLLGLKIRYPEHVTLIRGNHESRAMAAYHSMKTETLYKYSETTYNEFMEAFDALPVAATVAGPAGTFLCVHGGLSPAVNTIEAINALARFGEVPASGPLCDLMWSDPVPDATATGLSGSQLRQWKEITFEFNEQRGCSYRYGRRAVRDFLTANGLVGIIRAHEVQENGYNEHRFREEAEDDPLSPFPLVTTVFSAPNYCEMYDNSAAVALYDGTTLEFVSYECVEHPFGLPDYMDSLNWSLPYVMEKVTQFFAVSLKLIEGDSDSDSDDDEPMQTDAGPASPVSRKASAKALRDAARAAAARKRANQKAAAEAPEPATAPDTAASEPPASSAAASAAGTPGSSADDASAPEGDDAAAFRSRTSRVRTRKRPAMRQRSSSNICNETIRTRRASMNTLLRRAEKLRERNMRLLVAANDDDDDDDDDAADDTLSRFERALRKDSKREYLRPLQRHYTM
ncbi:serine/threonine-protein phosphatase 2B catalytic subunit 3 [Thecamonas trahens ATCC 50062]|uniref:Serine/threonine-protein phosphatase n=1 Tax=Thecamonas trahens ATCC 50062 TaxID=461836 RepID=A0A0L0DPG0_THETB|nr:serine/threonine-protein phosphatase 2B catalytic subunit 3 [Thecamonas trahens ATCC 50062]KNC53911.1 serine/threonine-protein phosphatase 2B catalytic subunit 3 [Thecamonas trahens ATCC 50062]|eukprot:XP_013754117.1 serine/threonine-protein phosphatase 2B catalytic subunit 3 [Thecamonas trahens ATCC 50062]